MNSYMIYEMFQEMLWNQTNDPFALKSNIKTKYRRWAQTHPADAQSVWFQTVECEFYWENKKRATSANDKTVSYKDYKLSRHSVYNAWSASLYSLSQ